jgi:hypothetical protein
VSVTTNNYALSHNHSYEIGYRKQWWAFTAGKQIATLGIKKKHSELLVLLTKNKFGG